MPVFELDGIRNKTCFAEIVPDNTLERRRMKQVYVFDELQLVEKPYIEVNLIPGEYSDVSKLGFDWDAVMDDD